MDWQNWLGQVGTKLVDGGISYANNNQQIKANNAANLMQLQAMQMQQYNNWGEPYIQGQPVQGNVLGIPPILLIGAIVVAVVMVKN
ncbi:hypothetical protein [Oxalicibacterium faecigallinarum]|uniref:Uncharacterized protein n=1 Tax=Oxalicibacterium faecigallinarum TaxID=573741 RepID=A0A8J3ALY5_9BURK|nr:hypothetical protein [Oxalicibacterium faecigallinarum]GGI16903.1 hypothetical protein GCM10008066_06290 [Oxalicibacterium faecigallinarum]